MRLKKYAIRLGLGIIGAIMIMAVVSGVAGFGSGDSDTVEAAKPAKSDKGGGSDKDGGSKKGWRFRKGWSRSSLERILECQTIWTAAVIANETFQSLQPPHHPGNVRAPG